MMAPTCPECWGGRPAGIVGDWLELVHMLPACSLGRAEQQTRHEDLAAAWTARPEFDRPTTAAELTLLAAARLDTASTTTRVR